MKFHIVPFGCQMNLSDTERIKAILLKTGFRETADEKDADILGLIACSVRQRAIDRVYARIRAWNALKSQRSLITFLTGCVLPADKSRFLKLFDLVFPIEEVSALPNMIRQYGTPSATSVLSLENEGTAGHEEGIEDFWRLRPAYESSIEAFVPIQNGCNKFCTFCAVPYTRGREVSRPCGEILTELRSLVDRGYKSLTLLGQNVNSYGLDRGEPSFPELLKEVGELGRKSGREFKVFFTSPHPRDMSAELFEIIAEYEVLAEQIHLPLQSGDDEILLRMNRKHSMERYEELVSQIHEFLPGATLFTDIIVGFPGETEARFEKTRAAMEQFRYDMAYIAQYSPRPGAVSARWEDDVPPAEKRRRLHVLTEVLHRGAAERNRARLGRVHRVLVTGKHPRSGHLVGYTEGRIPVRLSEGNEVLIGRFVDLEITSAMPLSLEGRPLERSPVNV